MTDASRHWRPSAEARARALAVAERELTPEEFSAQLGIPLTREEVEETAELVRWFTTRYPTVGERFAYVRRAFKRWTTPAVIAPEPDPGPAPRAATTGGERRAPP